MMNAILKDVLLENNEYGTLVCVCMCECSCEYLCFVKNHSIIIKIFIYIYI